MSILAYFIFAYSTYFVVLILTQLVSITVFKANKTLTLVMKSTELWCSLIYLTLTILYCLYNWHKLIIFIISYFSYIVSSLTKQSYKDFEFIHKISETTNFSIFPNITFTTTSISNLYAILYNLADKTLYINYLHFIED